MHTRGSTWLRRGMATLEAVLCLMTLSGTQTASQGQPVFQAAVDVIPVDVQVVDNLGKPVTGLTSDKFEVTVNGRRRRVVSASLIDLRSWAPPSAGSSSSAAPSAPGRTVEMVDAPRRIFILVVDAASFDESSGRAVLQAAADFTARLSPVDELGLFTYPIGPKIDPTTDHAAIARALGAVIARREAPPAGQFFLPPSTLVELARVPRTRQAEELRLRYCTTPPAPADEQCLAMLDSQVSGDTLFYEGMAQGNIGTLQSLMLELGKVPERKIAVLVSGGLVGSDLVGGRPDLYQLGFELGRTAARANVSVYSLFLDQRWAAQQSAETRMAAIAPDVGRDSAIVAKWLNEFSGAAGGSLLRVTTGTGASAFDRILSETSAYYLLAVEPAPNERDGRPYELRVKVNVPGVNVRGRSWVVVPKPGDAVARAEAAAPQPTIPANVAAPSAALPPTPPSVRALAEAFDRDDRPAIARALEPRNADTVIEAFRTSQSPWPTSPRRTAAFALDLAAAGLRSTSPFTKDAAGRLLGEYAIRVRQADTDDPFECTWFWAATAVLQGLYHVDAGPVFAQRGVDRCPSNPSLRLALAVVLDQQWTQTLLPNAARWSSLSSDALERRVLDAYGAARQWPDTRYEASVRAAYVHYRAGRAAEGLALFDASPSGGEDRQILYLGHLIRGLLLGGLGQATPAEAELQAALELWPGQAARVALAGLAIQQGQFDAAARLGEQVFTAPQNEQDPWWIYYLGDYRGYTAIRARLRSLAP